MGITEPENNMGIRFMLFREKGSRRKITKSISLVSNLRSKLLNSAHMSGQKLMQNFCVAYRNILSRHNLFATGTTGRLVEEAANLPVHKFLAGHVGGVQQLGAQNET